MAILSSKPLLALLVSLLAAGGGWFACRDRAPSAESIAEGRAIFEHEWQVNDPLGGGDGLGPVFNERSCVACHFQGGAGGGGSNQFNVTSFTVLPRPFDKAMHGGVVHAMATLPDFEESTATVRTKYPPVKGVPVVVDGCSLGVRDVDPVHYDTINTPPLFGLGLLDELSAHHIHLNGARRTWKNSSKALDNDFTVIPVGRLRVLKNRIGRFGWKGQFASLRDFVAAACAVELGLSNPYRRQDRPGEHAENPDAELDLNQRQFTALVDFVRTLPRPEQVLPNERVAAEAARGEAVFRDVGCATCHTPDYGGVKGVYSDFRLYDLTTDGTYADVPFNKDIPSDQPQLGDWKTPPLWGVADSAPYFHDGGSPTLMHAIQRHQGSALLSRDAFLALPKSTQESLLIFLSTLRAPRLPTTSDASQTPRQSS